MSSPGAFFESEPEELMQSNAHLLRTQHPSASQPGEAANQKCEFLFLQWRSYLRIIIEARDGKLNYKMKQEPSEVGTEIRNVGGKLIRTGRQKQETRH